jgi:hypothetical protein
MKPTHTGRIVPANSACLSGPYTTELRELKYHFVDKYGRKWRKGSGGPLGDKFPSQRLDIKSVRTI